MYNFYQSFLYFSPQINDYFVCTVSFLPLENNNFILTSNRDETPFRKAFPPKICKENEVDLMYPKDEFAGGTWIGASAKKRVVCLLNGAFIKHQRKDAYSMSRGMIVKKLLKVEDAITKIQQFNFIDIEPFTLILIEYNKALCIYELVWDGTNMFFKKLENQPKIWSSSTLYSDEMKRERQEWFADWLQENVFFTQESILKFHQDSTKGNKETAVKMKRTFVETVSITSIKKMNENLTMSYVDLLTHSFKQVQMKPMKL